MTIKVPFTLPIAAVEEFADANFGDARLNKRLMTVASRVESAPGASFPKSATSPSDLEATYRFLSNERVTSAAILAPHLAATRERAKTVGTLLAIEDTTEARFGGTHPREGLGALINGGQGFLFHASLLVGLVDEVPVPLGLGGYEIVVRTSKRPKPATKKEKKANERTVRADPDRESERWLRVALATEAALEPDGLKPIHVADREGDNFDFFGPLAKSRFVIRLAQPRVVTKVANFTPTPGRPRPLLDDAVVGLAVQTEREVPLSARVTSRGRRRVEAPRPVRKARLALTATSVEMPAPRGAHFREKVSLNIVEVTEVEPPEGQEPVHWRLLTTEPIDTAANICRVVDIYRARWLIEEFFKTLKSGCAMEQRQLETQAGLENALAVEIPIAWQMLLLRHIARDAPETPAANVVSPRLLELLMFMARTPVANRWGIKLSPAPTAKEALWAVARIGGHLPNNGAPGWLTVRRGFDELMTMLIVWPGCDR